MRRSVIALAVAMGLLLGAGGIAVVALVDDGGPEPLRVATGGAGSDERAGAAPAGADMAMAPYGGVEYRYVGPLVDLDREARAYRIEGAVTEDRVRELAAALGVEGELRVEGEEPYSSFVVSDDEHSLNVPRQAGGHWFVHRVEPGCVETRTPDGAVATCSFAAKGGSVGPDDPVSSDSGSGSGSSAGQTEPGAPGCPPGAECAPPEEPQPAPPVDCGCAPPPPCPEGADCVAASCVAPVPEPVPLPEPTPLQVPSREEAERIARDLFARTGLDLDAAQFFMDGGDFGWFAQATPVVDGRPAVGLTWSAAVGDQGRIESASGLLGRPVEGDVYPILSVEDAVERLNEQGGMGGWGPYGFAVDSSVAVVSGSGSGEVEAREDDVARAEQGGAGEQSVTVQESGSACVAPHPEPGTSGGGGGSAPSSGAAECPPEADCVAPEPREAPPGEPGPPPEKIVVELTGVELGLIAMPSEREGELLLVPAFLFTTRDSGDRLESRVTVPAVEDRFLPRPPMPEPMPMEGRPEPAPAEDAE